eukprot:1807673-Karenia_brevis.AAC.1
MTVKLPCSPDELLRENPREHQWASFGRRLWLQTDNQQIEQVFAGLSVLDVPSMRPLCIRISRLLRKLSLQGFRPRTDIQNYIEWDRRELNALADNAANIALDRA